MNVTVTGVDERTNMKAFEQGCFDAKCLDDIEVGILYTANPEGRNRYPSKEWMKKNIRHFDHVAIHVCGGTARSELLSGFLDGLIVGVDRIQVNGVVAFHELRHFCTKYRRHMIITQHTPKNAKLLDCDFENHSLLIDASGGRGITPDGWPLLDTQKVVGFAGGLDAEALNSELRKIEVVARDEAWLDAESKLRTDDWFDASKAIAFVLAANKGRP